MRLRVLLLVMSFFVAAVPVSLFWAWPHAQSVQHEFDSVRDRHLVLADKIAAALRRYHRDVVAAFDMVAVNLERDVPLVAADTLLGELGFRHLCLVDPESGRVIRHVAVDRTLPTPTVFTRARLAALLEGASADAVSFGDLGTAPDGRPMLTMVRRIGDALAVAQVDTGYLVELGRSVAFGRRGHAIIVDERGRALAYPIEAWAREMRDLSALAPVARARAGERGVDRFVSPAFHEDMIAAFSPVAGTGWSVIVPQPVRELEAAAARTHRSILAVFVVGLGLALLLAVAVSLVVLAPVRAVIVAARRRTAGERDARADARHGRLLRDGGELIQSFNAMADAVDVAQAEQQAARERAELASAAKTRFLANVSHELRTPLNAILGFAEVLQRGDARGAGQQRRAEYLGYIHQSGTHLLALINDLLDLSKIDAGARRVDASEFPARGLLNEVMELMRTQAAARDIRLVLDDRLDGARLHADERALRQVLLNLMANAVRYTHRGDTVALAAARDADGGVVVSVSDNGPGIPADELARVLEPFQRGAEATARGQEGTGLGLPISRRLVELHGGTLRLESTPGDGTRAIVVLPASRVSTQPDGDATGVAA
jgi:signal transduction histidine kinase